jgi:orotate phosphoribosyltransferase
VIVALDRQEKGKGELSAIQEVEQNFGIFVASIINLSHLITYLKGQNDAALIDKIEAYREQYGI